MRRSALPAFVLLCSCSGAPAGPPSGPEPRWSPEEERIVARPVREVLLQDLGGPCPDRRLVTGLRKLDGRIARAVRQYLPRSPEARIHLVNELDPRLVFGLDGDVFVSLGLLAACRDGDEAAAVLTGARLKIALGHVRQAWQAAVPGDLSVRRLAGVFRSRRPYVGEPAPYAWAWIGIRRLAHIAPRLSIPDDVERKVDSYVLRVVVNANFNPAAVASIQERLGVGDDRLKLVRRRLRVHYADSSKRTREGALLDEETRKVVMKARKAVLQGRLHTLDEVIRVGDRPVFRLHRGRLYLRQRESARALSDFEAAMTRTHRVEPLYLAAAQAYRQMGRYGWAAHRLREALELVRRPETYALLADCLERLGEFARAKAAYRNALALWGVQDLTRPPGGQARQAWTRYKLLEGR